MKQYIDKDALVAEMERRINELSQLEKASYEVGLSDAYKIILSFLDTIEEKEVDLEKEIDNMWNSHFNLGCDEKSALIIKHEGFTNIARHFFELGLKAQRKISYVPNIDDSLKELGVDPDSKEAKIFKESYYTALEKLKAQKGE